MNVLGQALKYGIESMEKAGIPQAEEDPYRLKFHLMPPAGWLNDPNGLCQSRGLYHVFFQYSPFDVNGGLKTWGHYTSRDLLCWNYEGVPLLPDSPYDCHGVYSGSALAEGDGMLKIFYTGNVKHEGAYDYINEGREANTIYCTSEDGHTFGYKRCVLTGENYPEDYTCHIRDPKVWKQDGSYYMVLGGRKKGEKERGAILLYRSEDGLHWSFYREMSTEAPFGYMWECPDMFCTDGKWVLSVSPQGLPREKFRFQNIYQAGYFLIGSGKMPNVLLPEQFEEWDMGFDFYAPQTFEDEKGRRLLIGWIGMPDSSQEYGNPTTDFGWQHALTVPRQVTAGKGRLLQMPAEELKSLRGREKTPEDGKWTLASGTAFDMEITDIGSQPFWLALSKGLELRFSDGVFQMVFLDNETGRKMGAGRIIRQARIPELEKLRILVDTSVLELYLNNGEYVFTTRYYPEGKITVEIKSPCASCRLWEIGAMKISYF
ncbi:glycoside hydrolase family 32 protein [Lacrimispora sp. NSJ-141]|uniref:Sucrose-6-phosphate hydrolase n=1 Tax=Lientehia hominis TaxID=2897778 RepID=A0AAP2W9Q4_9FIRM|nr:glycoside hydrolase family 32 protein [Lientehia hominis]MCD2493571.1 glycoside hydrolase family 32 protein [Lientehia hominis]